MTQAKPRLAMSAEHRERLEQLSRCGFFKGETMTHRRSFFGALTGAIAGLFGVKAVAGETGQFTARLVTPEPMTLEQAVEVLNRHRYRNTSWERGCPDYPVIRDRVFATSPSGTGQGFAYHYYLDLDIAIAVAEKLEREHRAVLREFTGHMI